MRVLHVWPEKPKKLSFTDRTEPLCDGRIYEFTLDDAAEWGIQISSISERFSDEENAINTEYYRSRALPTLLDKIRSAALKIRGPYQTRFLLSNDTLLFQFTGLRECRFNVCTAIAIEGGKGYCEVDYELKHSQGKV